MPCLCNPGNRVSIVDFEPSYQLLSLTKQNVMQHTGSTELQDDLSDMIEQLWIICDPLF